MTKKILGNSIDDFWNWFLTIEGKLSEGVFTDEMLNELDSRILAFGQFTWEIGPGKIKENSFVVSPGGDKDLLDVSKEIIASAPLHPKWEFYPAVPIKAWEYIFNFQSIDGNLIELDASGWEYVLLEYPDETVEIILKAPSLMELTVDDRIIAAEILLDGAIGEEIRIEKIGFIDIVGEFEQEYKDRSSPIKVIEKHFRRIGLIR